MRSLAAISLTLTMIASAGCQSHDMELAREALNRQADQNEAMAALQREVAAGVSELAVADAEARRQSGDLQRDLQAERRQLNGGWSDLHAQRQRDTLSLRTHSLLAAIVQGGGATAAALFALAIVRSVMSPCSDSDDTELAALMLEAFPPADAPLEIPSIPPSSAKQLASPRPEEL